MAITKKDANAKYDKLRAQLKKGDISKEAFKAASNRIYKMYHGDANKATRNAPKAKPAAKPATKAKPAAKAKPIVNKPDGSVKATPRRTKFQKDQGALTEQLMTPEQRKEYLKLRGAAVRRNRR